MYLEVSFDHVFMIISQMINVDYLPEPPDIYTDDFDLRNDAEQLVLDAAEKQLEFPTAVPESATVYYTDVEIAYVDDDDYGSCIVSKKWIVDNLTLEAAAELIQDLGLMYDSETMGSLTYEYGWLPAKSYTCDDGTEYINAYVSMIWSKEVSPEYTGEIGEDIVDKVDTYIEANNPLLFEALDELSWEDIQINPYVVILNQLKLPFNNN